MIKKKFLDPNLNNKAKTVENKIQLYKFQGENFPLPTEIEISESRVIDHVHFVQEVLLILRIKKNSLPMSYTKNYA